MVRPKRISSTRSRYELLKNKQREGCIPSLFDSSGITNNACKLRPIAVSPLLPDPSVILLRRYSTCWILGSNLGHPNPTTSLAKQRFWADLFLRECSQIPPLISYPPLTSNQITPYQLNLPIPPLFHLALPTTERATSIRSTYRHIAHPYPSCPVNQNSYRVTPHFVYSRQERHLLPTTILQPCGSSSIPRGWHLHLTGSSSALGTPLRCRAAHPYFPLCHAIISIAVYLQGRLRTGDLDEEFVF